MDYLTQRRLAAAKNLKKDGIDALLVTNPVNVTYLTGFSGDSSYVVIGAKQFIIVSDSRFEEQLKEECKEIETHIRPHNKRTHEAAAEVLTKMGAKNIGLEAAHATLGLQSALAEAGPKLTFTTVQNAIESLRVVKDPSEVEQIRASIRVAERAFTMFKAMISEMDTEKDMVDRLEHYIRRAGAKKAAFPPIVAVGERGALPHAPPTTSRNLGDGSKLLVDWGAELTYNCDITRTFRSPYGTAPTRKNKHERVGFNFDELYVIVSAAQDAAVGAIRHGAHGKDVDAAARKVFADARTRDDASPKLHDYFTHGTGHGIGLEVHESPQIRANSDDILEAGMVVTIEPGLYIPGWGGLRIEDNYMVTKDGAIRLTTLPRDPNAIG